MKSRVDSLRSTSKQNQLSSLMASEDVAQLLQASADSGNTETFGQRNLQNTSFSSAALNPTQSSLT